MRSIFNRYIYRIISMACFLAIASTTVISNAENTSEDTNTHTEATPNADRKKAAEEKLKTAEDKLKTAEGKLKTVEEKLKTAEKNQKAAEDKLKAAEGKLKTVEEKLKTAEKNQKAAEDKLKAAEDKLKTAEKNQKAAEDKLKAAEDKLKAAEDKLKAAEDKLKTAEEKPKTAEEKPKTAEEKPKTAEEKPTLVLGSTSQSSMFLTIDWTPYLLVLLLVLCALIWWLARPNTHGQKAPAKPANTPIDPIPSAPATQAKPPISKDAQKELINHLASLVATHVPAMDWDSDSASSHCLSLVNNNLRRGDTELVGNEEFRIHSGEELDGLFVIKISLPKTDIQELRFYCPKIGLPISRKILSKHFELAEDIPQTTQLVCNPESMHPAQRIDYSNGTREENRGKIEHCDPVSVPADTPHAPFRNTSQATQFAHSQRRQSAPQTVAETMLGETRSPQHQYPQAQKTEFQTAHTSTHQQPVASRQVALPAPAPESICREPTQPNKLFDKFASGETISPQQRDRQGLESECQPAHGMHRRPVASKQTPPPAPASKPVRFEPAQLEDLLLQVFYREYTDKEEYKNGFAMEKIMRTRFEGQLLEFQTTTWNLTPKNSNKGWDYLLVKGHQYCAILVNPGMTVVDDLGRYFNGLDRVKSSMPTVVRVTKLPVIILHNGGAVGECVEKGEFEWS